MKRLILGLAVLALCAPAGARAGSSTITVLNEGTLFGSLAYANYLGSATQDPVKCSAHNANHHTHGPLPGEGNDVSGWCDAIQFRTFTVTVPTEDDSGRSFTSGTLNIGLHFASGDEPPTDQLPADEKSRGECDAELSVQHTGAEIANTLGAAGWLPFMSPHTLAGDAGSVLHAHRRSVRGRASGMASRREFDPVITRSAHCASSS